MAEICYKRTVRLALPARRGARGRRDARPHMSVERERGRDGARFPASLDGPPSLPLSFPPLRPRQDRSRLRRHRRNKKRKRNQSVGTGWSVRIGTKADRWSLSESFTILLSSDTNGLKVKQQTVHAVVGLEG